MPHFLAAGEFAGNKMSSNARFLYTLLLDRHRISVKNGWFDDSGEVYIYFKREEMEAQLGLSERTVSKVMQELKDLLLVEEKQQGLNKPNKIYLLSPIVGNDENADAYLDPDDDYAPEAEIITGSDTQDLRPWTRKSYASEPAESVIVEPVNSTAQDPQYVGASDSKTIKNNYNQNNEKNNNFSENEGSDTTTASGSGAVEAAKHMPYQQILDKYNELCQTKGLRAIRSIEGKRKVQVAARFKDYRLDGFAETILSSCCFKYSPATFVTVSVRKINS